MHRLPIIQPKAAPRPVPQPLVSANYGEGDDARLRSAKALNRYHIAANDGTSGDLCSFMMDTQNWEIRELVVKLGHGRSAREVNIPAQKVDGISDEDSAISVNLSFEEIEGKSTDQLVPVGMIL
jgi:hypothetical protein